MISVRKLQLTIINDNDDIIKQQYKFIRDSQYAQYKGLNETVSYLATGYYASGMSLSSDGYKKIKNSIKNSSFIYDSINFGTGIDTKSMIHKRVKKDFENSVKNGIAKGERRISNYKRDYPLLTRGRDIKIYEENNEYYIKWVNKIIFKIILSHKTHKNYLELEHTIRKILNGDYKVCESGIFFNKKNKLMLNLTLDIPYTKDESFIDSRVVGVDLGIKIPAYCSLNDTQYIYQAIGSIDDLLRVRQQFKSRKDRLQKKLGLTQGYKLRYKSKELDNLNSKEKNYAQTYNHMVSKRIIEFAKKNKAGQINLELLSMSGDTGNSAIIRYWGYYQLQKMIESKAEREGIKVMYVDPYHTSQTCSICGHYESGQRTTQEEFVCKGCGHKENADLNASRTIAKSTNYITKKEESQYYKNMKEAM
jgi:IS605 OrfB family transposase